MLLRRPHQPLEPSEVELREPNVGEVRVKVGCCAVCRTDLHVVDGELPDPKLPLIVGHQIVGTDDRGRRLGIPWLGWTCGVCNYCTSGREVYAFTRDGDDAAQAFALRMGAVWAGGSSEAKPLDAAIIFAPAGELVVTALRNVVKGGTVVCAGIHMSDIPSFPYALLWGERVVRSVANLTRADGVALFDRLKTLRVVTERTSYPLERANDALSALRSGELTGTAVLHV